MTVRPATATDRDAILALLLEASRDQHYAPWFHADGALVLGLIDAVIQQGGAFVLVVEGTVQGVGGFAVLTHHYSGEAYLEELAWYVRPAFRAGLPLVLDQGTHFAQRSGVSLMKVTAPVGVPSVDRAYRRRGFVPFETAYLRRV